MGALKMSRGMCAAAILMASASAALAQDVAVDAAIQAKVPQAVSATGKVVNAAFPNVPYTIPQESGVTGAGVELAAAIGQVLGLPTEQSVIANTAAARVGVQSGRYNFAMGPIIDTAEVEKELDVIPWTKTSPGFLYRAEETRNDVLEFCGVKFGIVSGSIPAERNMEALTKACAAAGKPEQEVAGYSDQNAMILALEAGRADAVLMTSAAAAYAASVRGDRLKAFMAESDIFGVGQFSGVVLKKGEPLSEVVLEAMQKLQADGVYDRIMEKYNLTGLRVEKMQLNPMTKAN